MRCMFAEGSPSRVAAVEPKGQSQRALQESEFCASRRRSKIYGGWAKNCLLCKNSGKEFSQIGLAM